MQGVAWRERCEAKILCEIKQVHVLTGNKLVIVLWLISPLIRRCSCSSCGDTQLVETIKVL